MCVLGVRHTHVLPWQAVKTSPLHEKKRNLNVG